MNYSKKVEDLMVSYGLTPDEVIFSILVASGVSRSISYLYSHHPGGAVTDRMLSDAAGSMTKKNDRINKLINALRGLAFKEAKDTIKESYEGVDFASKDGVLDFLRAKAISSCGKEQLEVVKMIADLMRLKNEESKEEVSPIQFYLPVRCFNCKFRRSSNLRG